jgi:hypothetical protein
MRGRAAGACVSGLAMKMSAGKRHEAAAWLSHTAAGPCRLGSDNATREEGSMSFGIRKPNPTMNSL